MSTPALPALIAAAVAVGAAVPLQSAVNAQMGRHLGHPLYGALTNTAVASLILVALVLAFRVPLPRLGSAAGGPWWLWTGGAVGAAFVFGALFVAPKIGAASFAAATIFGTLAASLLIDHFGLLGFPLQPVSPQRLAGVGCVLAGLWLLNGPRG
jgi:transporter family-2 protein